MRDRRTLAQAKALLERYQMSGLSVKAFCAEEFINPVTLYYWRKRLHQLESQEPSMLVPVRLDRSVPEYNFCRILFRNHGKITCSIGFRHHAFQVIACSNQ
jgi:transposase-like protein